MGDQKPLKNLSFLLHLAVNLSTLNWFLSEFITCISLGGFPPLFLKILSFVVMMILFITASRDGSPSRICESVKYSILCPCLPSQSTKSCHIPVERSHSQN